ncbi:MAG TPA: hypothetical protein PKL65_04460 [Bacteroidales bacterium]|jgi:hypothetical protein|nr:3-oxoacyl-ACP synthase [Bacteroidales bacterium]HNR41462.1 hypothetical protein [Bacteroidales bacterium]HPM17811.1 hypothetical protein [Bacteroidales bacterium]HQG77127.1 hypothetical protein [Bacteroidales bacterium]
MTGYYITGYCIIRNNEASVNGKPVFSAHGKNTREFFTDLYKFLDSDYPKFHKMDNLCKLGFLSSELILKKNGVRTIFSGSDTGVILANSSSSLDTDRMHQVTIINRAAYFPSPAVFVYTLPNIVIGEICIRNKITGEGSFFIQEKLNPVFLTDYIRCLLDCEIINRCIAGWLQVDGDDCDAMMCLIEKTDKPISGFVNFEPSVIRDIYNLRI